MRSHLHLTAPALSARVGPGVLTSTLARLLASGVAECKADLARETGLSRSTVDAGVRWLQDRKVIRSAGLRPTPGRGRPADRLELNPEFGTVLVADCTAHTARLAIFDLGQEVVWRSVLQFELEEGPEAVLTLLSGAFHDHYATTPQLPKPVIAVVGLPGPVDNSTGTVVRPPIMPGWDGFPISTHLQNSLLCPVILENDVNLSALGEARALNVSSGPLLYIKLGTGIGSGLVTADGQLLHGADGSAGDIGHVRVAGADVPCVCGNTGCLEAVASASAVVRSLNGLDSAAKVSAADLHGLRALILAGDPVAVGHVRKAALSVGEVAANLVHVINPARIVLGGMLAVASDDVLATTRAIVYQRALPLATRNLSLGLPSLGGDSALAGGLVIGIEAVLGADLLTDHAGSPVMSIDVSRL